MHPNPCIAGSLAEFKVQRHFCAKQTFQRFFVVLVWKRAAVPGASSLDFRGLWKCLRMLRSESRFMKTWSCLNNCRSLRAICIKRPPNLFRPPSFWGAHTYWLLAPSHASNPRGAALLALPPWKKLKRLQNFPRERMYETTWRPSLR